MPALRRRMQLVKVKPHFPGEKKTSFLKRCLIISASILQGRLRWPKDTHFTRLRWGMTTSAWTAGRDC